MMLRVFTVVFLSLFIVSCVKERVVVKPEIILIKPQPVNCPEDPKITIDPRSDAFMDSMISEYIIKLRETKMICRSSKELQDKEIKELEKLYEKQG